MRELVEEGRRCLAALVKAAEAGELYATSAELAALRAALATLESLKLVHNTTV
jgi:hypothetical protein